MRVPASDFMAFAGLDFQEPLRLMEFLARNTAPHPHEEELRLVAGPRLHSGGLPDVTLLPQDWKEPWLLPTAQNPQNPGPNVNDLENRITQIVSNADCAKFISGLINRTASTTNPAEFTDALKGFRMIKSQRGFIYGDTIRKTYGFDGATVRGSISGRTAQVELPHPYPFQSYGPVNQRAAAEYAEAQAGIRAMATLHEILHLAGKNRYDDFDYANAVAAMRGVKPPDFTGMPYQEAVRRASEYWNGALEAACKPRVRSQ